jgi:hypothetical protein
MSYSPVSSCGLAGLLIPLAGASGQAMYPCLVPVLSASADGEDAKDGVSMRRGQFEGLTVLGRRAQAWLGQIVKKVS